MRHCRGLQGVRATQEDGELVAAEARHQITVTDDLANTGADLAQQRVPGVVSEGVVDLLEMVEVDQEQGQAVGVGTFVEEGVQGLLELVEEPSAVREPGELVGDRQVLARLIQRLLPAQQEGQPSDRRQQHGPGKPEDDRIEVFDVGQHHNHELATETNSE